MIGTKVENVDFSGCRPNPSEDRWEMHQGSVTKTLRNTVERSEAPVRSAVRVLVVMFSAVPGSGRRGGERVTWEEETSGYSGHIKAASASPDALSGSVEGNGGGRSSRSFRGRRVWLAGCGKRQPCCTGTIVTNHSKYLLGLWE